jgi:hypothetical protein
VAFHQNAMISDIHATFCMSAHTQSASVFTRKSNSGNPDELCKMCMFEFLNSCLTVSSCRLATHVQSNTSITIHHGYLPDSVDQVGGLEASRPPVTRETSTEQVPLLR